MRDSEGKVEAEGILYEKENQFFNHVENGSVEVHALKFMSPSQ